MADANINIGLNAVIMAVTEGVPRVLTKRPRIAAGAIEPFENSPTALPFGPFEPRRHRTLELGLRGWVEEQTGMELGYVEQLYTFADRNRDPRELAGGSRVVSIGYLALVREAAPPMAQTKQNGQIATNSCYGRLARRPPCPAR